MCHVTTSWWPAGGGATYSAAHFCLRTGTPWHVQCKRALKCARNVQYTLNFLGQQQMYLTPTLPVLQNIQEMSRKLAKYSWTSKSHHVRMLHNISFPLMAPQSVPRQVHAAQSLLPVARPRRKAQPSKTDPC